MAENATNNTNAQETSHQQAQNTQIQAAKDKEYNFRLIEAKLAQERAEKQQMAMELAQEREKSKRNMPADDDDNDSEPYVDHKRLKKEQTRFGQQIKQETKEEVQQAVRQAIYEERQSNWLKSHPDFDSVLSNADKLYEHDQELAETILEMPKGFEQQKLVYKNIKALGLDKPKNQEPTIQQKIDANKRSPYYMPSGVGSAPYAAAGDFSKSGQKSSYDKMQELKGKLRL
jgi:hypothetical protein